MQRDIRLMKQANVNAVRTSRYPECSRWCLELCDMPASMVMDEADCETHGLRGTPTLLPTGMPPSGQSRENGRKRQEPPEHHLLEPRRESGFGANHAAMAGWFHTFDPTRTGTL